MVQVSSKKVKAFVEKVRMGKYKTPDNEPNYGGKPQVPQSQTISNSKADERNLDEGPTPAEEDQAKLDKYDTDWQGYDQADRTLQDIEEEQKDRAPASDGMPEGGGSPHYKDRLTDAQRRTFTLNLAKQKRKK